MKTKYYAINSQNARRQAIGRKREPKTRISESGPFPPDASGSINPVDATIPPSSPGRALICFQNGNSLTRPADFTVEGSMYRQPG